MSYANWIFRNQEAIVILLKSNTNETKENEPETEPKKIIERNQEKIIEKEPLSEKLAENVKFDQSEMNQSEPADQLDVDEIEKDCLISHLNVAVTGTKKECDTTDRPLERG